MQEDVISLLPSPRHLQMVCKRISLPLQSMDGGLLLLHHSCQVRHQGLALSMLGRRGLHTQQTRRNTMKNEIRLCHQGINDADRDPLHR
jgi:hypothetical protein